MQSDPDISGSPGCHQADTVEEKHTGGVGVMLLKIGPSRVIRPMMGLAAIALLTRFLGPDGYGVFAILTQTILLTVTLLFSWANHAALRFRSPMNGALEGFFTSLFIGQLGSMACLLLVVIVARPFIPEGYVQYMWLGIPVVVVVAWAEILKQCSLAMRRMWRFTLVELGLSLVRLLGVIAVIILGGNLHGYLGVLLAGAVVVFLFQARAARIFSQISFRHVDWGLVRQMLAFGLPLIVVIVANIMRQSLNRYIVLYFCTDADVGLYSASASLGAMPMAMTQQLVLMGLYPLAVHAWENSAEDAAAVIRSGIRYFLLLALPAAGIVTGFAKSIIVLVSGTEFVSSWPVLALSPWTVFLAGLAQYYTLSFLLENKSWKMIVTNGAGGVVTTALAVVLVPLMGYCGAAVAAMAGAAAMLSVAIVMSRSTLRLKFPWRHMVRCSLGAMPVFAAGVASSLLGKRYGMAFTAGALVLGLGATFLVLLWTGEIKDIIQIVRARIGSRPGKEGDQSLQEPR